MVEMNNFLLALLCLQFLGYFTRLYIKKHVIKTDDIDHVWIFIMSIPFILLLIFYSPRLVQKTAHKFWGNKNVVEQDKI